MAPSHISSEYTPSMALGTPPPLRVIAVVLRHGDPEFIGNGSRTLYRDIVDQFSG